MEVLPSSTGDTPPATTAMTTMPTSSNNLLAIRPKEQSLQWSNAAEFEKWLISKGSSVSDEVTEINWPEFQAMTSYLTNDPSKVMLESHRFLSINNTWESQTKVLTIRKQLMLMARDGKRTYPVRLDSDSQARMCARIVDLYDNLPNCSVPFIPLPEPEFQIHVADIAAFSTRHDSANASKIAQGILENGGLILKTDNWETRPKSWTDMVRQKSSVWLTKTILTFEGSSVPFDDIKDVRVPGPPRSTLSIFYNANSNFHIPLDLSVKARDDTKKDASRMLSWVNHRNCSPTCQLVFPIGTFSNPIAAYEVPTGYYTDEDHGKHHLPLDLQYSNIFMNRAKTVLQKFTKHDWKRIFIPELVKEVHREMLRNPPTHEELAEAIGAIDVSHADVRLGRISFHFPSEKDLHPPPVDTEDIETEDESEDETEE